MSKVIKKTHGQNLDKKDSLASLFDTEDARIVTAETKLENLSLEELQRLAKNLGLLVVDSRNLLIKAIKASMRD